MEHKAQSFEKVNIFAKEFFFSLSLDLGSKEACSAAALALEKAIATDNETVDDVPVTVIQSASSIIKSSKRMKVLSRFGIYQSTLND